MALDETTAGLVTQMAGAKPVHEMTPDEARGLRARLPELYGPGPEMHAVSEGNVPTADGGSFGVRVLAPEHPHAVIIYCHGGGWVIGTVAESDTLGRQLAQRTGAAVVLVDYRLAPEHRYPAAVDDAWSALHWVDERIA